ncbi:molybdopterin-guanine dinucleotide biosynthesis protein B [Diaphorobacter aerolatus]|uniref:Molybdopterin-guanine dinucleotide biosynthesis protein B n=1 Tax=Diaphorobacter aerolatus TaxID=1288495 RepID=A0A7H0GN19_9BURK|nr:molybdopterin-guanine dinucleotide biosynthesis protein B [Diaphorobacter aerolatus]QNP49685.1 molybdopterin-guanine dinucleotide biosynthesis protein B [Diaphorobacter aerolatus]
MKAIGFAGYSGAGKTTVLEQVIRLLRERGERVSVVKHAHHGFDVDLPGKDSWRHRQAGAFEVLVVSDQRLALMREFEQACPELSVHDMLAELDPSVDWAIVEGFKTSDLPKIEIWREPQAHEKPRTLRCLEDAAVVAVATDDADRLRLNGPLTMLDLNDPATIVDWMQAHAGRFAYAGHPDRSTQQQQRHSKESSR